VTGPTDAGPLLAAAGVTRRFGSFAAVHDVSVTVGPGEIVGLLGANGAGKTTLIRMMLGLLAPSEGHIRMFGTTPSRRSRRRLGYVPQGLGLYLDMTVTENVSFNAAAFGISTDQIVLNEELRELSDRLVGSIGLGRQRQLAFACALGHHPELIVLDEPTSGVDPLARARLWDTIRSEAHRGVGVLVTTHYMDEAEQCDRLVLMATGCVAAEGTLAAIIADRTVVQVSAASWSDAFAALCDAGHDVTLAGRRIRVAGADVPQVSRTLQAAGIDAELTVVPAILDEAMVAVSASR
jgi:ABC-2 type transport system ATP-binding protein/ribosome-dependent ATPase